MIRIAMCDDDVSVLNEIRGFLEQYSEACGRKIACAAFDNPLDLMAEIDHGMRYDILFIDVLMPGENGMDAAAEIRSCDSNVKIIFLTSSSEYAVQSYAVNAYAYQLKPMRKESFNQLMDNVLGACEQEKTNSLILRSRDGITRVELTRIEYCEVIHRTLFIHLTSGRVLEVSGSMDDFCGQLSAYGNFLRPHRSFLVNLDYVQNLSYRAITMRCLSEIPVPRGKYNEIKNAFLEYAFANRQVMI